MTMTTTLTLSDSQLVLLSTASRRPDGLLVRPKYLRRATLEALTAAGLIEPVVVTAGDPVWHEDDGNIRHGYLITPTGLRAIGLEPESAGEGTAADAAVPPAKSNPSDADVHHQIRTRQQAGTKRALVLSLLQREQGASLADLMQATGWLAHTTRAALSGLRKRGTVIERIRAAGAPSCYRVNESPVSGQADAAVATAEGPVNGAGA
jgi:hypothetical protein